MAIHQVLFEATRTSLKRALKQAWRRALYGSVRLTDLSDRVLFTTMAEALGILFEEAQSSEKYKGCLSGDVTAVREASKRKRRPVDSERRACAMRVAIRYCELHPQVIVFRDVVKKHPLRPDLVRLNEALERDFPSPWIHHVTRGSALQNLPEIAGHSNKATLNELLWTARQLTVGIVWCEERNRDPAFSVRPATILEHYLPLGKSLNTKLP